MIEQLIKQKLETKLADEAKRRQLVEESISMVNAMEYRIRTELIPTLQKFVPEVVLEVNGEESPGTHRYFTIRSIPEATPFYINLQGPFDRNGFPQVGEGVSGVLVLFQQNAGDFEDDGYDLLVDALTNWLVQNHNIKLK